MSRKCKNRFAGVGMRGDSGVAGEGRRVAGIPKFHSWDKCARYAHNISLKHGSTLNSIPVQNKILSIYLCH